MESFCDLLDDGFPVHSEVVQPLPASRNVGNDADDIVQRALRFPLPGLETGG